MNLYFIGRGIVLKGIVKYYGSCCECRMLLVVDALYPKGYD